MEYIYKQQSLSKDDLLYELNIWYVKLFNLREDLLVLKSLKTESAALKYKKCLDTLKCYLERSAFLDDDILKFAIPKNKIEVVKWVQIKTKIYKDFKMR